jgi:hypothetical protein
MTLAQFNSGLSLVSVAFPEVAAAAAAFKAIWTVMNPGATEQSYIDHLGTYSATLIVDSDTILTGLGYVRDPVTGTWSKPPALAPVPALTASAIPSPLPPA